MGAHMAQNEHIDGNGHSAEKTAKLRSSAINALIALGLDPDVAASRAEGATTASDLDEIIRKAREETGHKEEERENVQPEPVESFTPRSDSASTHTSSEAPAQDSAADVEQGEFRGSAMAQLLAGSIRRNRADHESGLQGLRGEITKAYRSMGVNNPDVLRRLGHVEQLLDGDASQSRAYKELKLSISRLAQDIRSPEEHAIIARLDRELSELAGAGTSARDLIKDLTTLTMAQQEKEAKAQARKASKGEQGWWLLDGIQNSAVKSPASKLEAILAKQIADTDAELMRTSRLLEIETETIQAMRHLHEEAGRSTRQNPVEVQTEQARSMALNEARKTVLARWNADSQASSKDPSAALRADAAAHAILSDPASRDLARKNGVDEQDLVRAATRHAAKDAQERDQAASQVLLTGFETTELETVALMKAASARAEQGLKADPEHTARLAHLRSQGGEHLAELAAARKGFGNDGLILAAESRARIRGESIEAATQAVAAHAAEPRLERDRSQDAAATAKQAREAAVPEALTEEIKGRAALNREARQTSTQDKAPNARVLVVELNELEAQSAYWTDLASRGGAIGNWAAIKQGSVERELDARAAHMKADPDTMRYVAAAAKQETKAKDLPQRIDQRAERHAQGMALDELPEDRLMSGWRFLDKARGAADTALADPGLSNRLPSNLRAELTSDRMSLDQQAQQAAYALQRSGQLRELLNQARALHGDDAARDMAARIDKDATAYTAAAPDRAKAEVAALANTDARLANRGRTSHHAEENITSLLRNGECKHGLGASSSGFGAHFPMSSRDADLRVKEHIEELTIREPRTRSLNAEIKPSERRQDVGQGAEQERVQERTPSDIARERAAINRNAALKRSVSELVTRDVRDERTRIALDAADKGGMGGRMFRSIKDDWNWFNPSKEKDLAKAHGQDQRAIYALRRKGHAQNMEDILARAAEGKMTVADANNLNAYGHNDWKSGKISTLQTYLRDADRMEGRKQPSDKEIKKGQAGPTLTYAAKLGAMDKEEFRRQAPGILADIQLERFEKTMGQRHNEFLLAGQHLATGKNFGQGYVPNEKEIQMAREISGNSAANDKLLTDQAKLEQLREKNPGRTDEQLATMRGAKGKEAQRLLRSEQVALLVDSFNRRELSREYRRGEGPMRDTSTVAQEAARDRPAQEASRTRPAQDTERQRREKQERERQGRTRQPGTERTGEKSRDGAKTSAEALRQKNPAAFDMRSKVDQAATSGRYPNLNKFGAGRAAERTKDASQGKERGGGGISRGMSR